MAEKPTYEVLERRLEGLEKRILECEEKEHTLRRRYRRLHAAIESLPFDFFAIDADGRYAMQNTVCMEHWGDLVGKRPQDLSTKSDTLALWLDNNRRAFSGETVQGDVEFTVADEQRHFYNIISPLLKNGEIEGIVGINIDMTDRKRMEKKLLEANEELKAQTCSFDELNTALKVLLEHREKDTEELQKKVVSNVKELISPYVETLRNTRLDTKQLTCVEIIESNLKEIVSPFLQKLALKYSGFTPKEIQIAGLIKQGKTTKEIAELFNLSTRTIKFHRQNIRAKLGLKNQRKNLASYLLSLP